LTRKIINQQTNRKNKMKTKVISKFGIIFAGDEKASCEQYFTIK